MRKSLFILAIGLLFGSSQVAFAHDEPVKDPEAWKSSLSFGFNLTDGNSETTLLNLQAKAEREKDSNIWRFEGGHSFGEENSETNVDKSNVLAQYKRLLSERLYAGLGSEYNRDELADVSYRVTVDPVLGYFLVKSEELRFSVEAGPGYLFEEVGDVKSDYFSPFAGERVEYQLSKTAKLFEEAQIRFDIDDSDNYLVSAKAGVETAVTELLSLIVSVEDKYDNVPAEGLKRNDVTVLTSLAVNF